MATGALLSVRVARGQGQGLQYGAAYDALKQQELRTENHSRCRGWCY